MKKTLIVAALAAFFAASAFAEAGDTCIVPVPTNKTPAVYKDKDYTVKMPGEWSYLVVEKTKDGYLVETAPGQDNLPPKIVGYVKKKDYRVVDFRNCNF